MHGRRGAGIIAILLLCVWCGWVGGFHRTTLGAEVTWLVTVAAVLAFDAGLWPAMGTGHGALRLEPA